VFCAQTGEVLSRRFHKFFNLNEREETNNLNIDWGIPHVVLHKMDGSMISPIFLDGEIRWGTKMGITDVGLQCEKFVKDKQNYCSFAYAMNEVNLTPIFEYIAPSNRIVIEYQEENLVLLAIRHNKTGEYVSYDKLVDAAKFWNVPVVQKYSGPLFRLKEQTDIEGVVVLFENGHMLKIKTDWYIAIHKAKENLLFEKNVIKLILNEQLDDILPNLPEKDRDRLLEYRTQLVSSIDTHVKECKEFIDYLDWLDNDRKSIASIVNESIPEFARSIIFKCLDDTTKLRDEWIKKILTKTSTQATVDSIRSYIGATWNVGSTNKE
jgi:RNA ligase